MKDCGSSISILLVHKKVPRLKENKPKGLENDGVWRNTA